MTLANTVNFSNTTPSPDSGYIAGKFKDDGGSPTVNISTEVPILVGDTGSGGTAGVAPAPPSGSAAGGKFLKADGTWTVPPGSGGSVFTVELVTVSGTSGTLAHTPANIIGIFKNGQYLTTLGGSPDYSISTATLTFTVAAGGSDVYVAVYWY